MPWSSFASFLASRQEKALYRGRGSLAGYIENSRKSQFSRMTDLQTGTRLNLAGVPDALIFFCFFSSIKRRKEDYESLLDSLMRPSFLSLRKEKRQKKLKPSAEGGEVCPGTSRITESSQFGWHPWCLDLLLLLFFYQEKKRRSWGQKDLTSKE